MRVTSTKTKNSESFYITQSYKNNKGHSTSKVVRKLGTLSDLLQKLNFETRDQVVMWANEQARIETEKYNNTEEEKNITITFHADREMEYDRQRHFVGGYLFLQSISNITHPKKFFATFLIQKYEGFFIRNFSIMCKKISSKTA